MIERGLGYNTNLFSGIRARRGGLSTPPPSRKELQHVLACRADTQDAKSWRYVKLGSLAPLYKT